MTEYTIIQSEAGKQVKNQISEKSFRTCQILNLKIYNK